MKIFFARAEAMKEKYGRFRTRAIEGGELEGMVIDRQREGRERWRWTVEDHHERYVQVILRSGILGLRKDSRD